MWRSNQGRGSVSSPRTHLRRSRPPTRRRTARHEQDRRPARLVMEPGTAHALKLYKEKMRADAQTSEHVFLDPQQRPHTKFGLAMLLRGHLKAIGLKDERPELFASTAERRQIRVHDLRGTFVTVSLANGKSEAWVSDRTGHRSSQMINNYKRTARSFMELEAGQLAPL